MIDEVRSGIAGGVMTLVMARPAKRNALTPAMYAALADALAAADADPAVGAIVIRGEGESFTAGNDLTDFLAIAGGQADFSSVVRFLHALAALAKPLVAAVQGRAVGVGLTMLLHCDYVLLSPDARLSAPFVSLALVPEAASSVLLPAAIGHRRAYAVFALGEEVTAEQALAWGLANRIVPADALPAEALSVAARLAAQPQGALVSTKRLMRDAGALTACMEGEMRQFHERLLSAEAREAFQAFIERRQPDFSRPS